LLCLWITGRTTPPQGSWNGAEQEKAHERTLHGDSGVQNPSFRISFDGIFRLGEKASGQSLASGEPFISGVDF